MKRKQGGRLDSVVFVTQFLVDLSITITIFLIIQIKTKTIDVVAKVFKLPKEIGVVRIRLKE